MNVMVDESDCHQLLSNIKKMIEEAHINDNAFYKQFRATKLCPETMKTVFQQYYYYIRTFPQILAGASARTSSELVRMKLARTVVSELGDGIGDPHFIMFEKVLASLGVTLDPIDQADHIPEVEGLVDGLRRLLLKEPSNVGLGAHYVIEEIGLPMIVNLYEGFRLYDGWRTEDYGYFYLHMLVETDHVEWIRDAVIDVAGTGSARTEILTGAREVIALLANFWNGLYRLSLA
jgi:pyrroloquinoline-quinone synthase